VRLFFSKICIVISGIFLLGHNIVPHHHDMEGVSPNNFNAQNQHDDDLHHHIFSYGHLDDNFICVQVKDDINLTFDFIIKSHFIDFANSTPLHSSLRNYFLEGEDLPPPDKYFTVYSHRGPPIV
jgi:hypothetical protein